VKEVRREVRDCWRVLRTEPVCALAGCVCVCVYVRACVCVTERVCGIERVCVPLLGRGLAHAARAQQAVGWGVGGLRTRGCTQAHQATLDCGRTARLEACRAQSARLWAKGMTREGRR